MTVEMIDELQMERYELAKNRIWEICQVGKDRLDCIGKYRDYMIKSAALFCHTIEIYELACEGMLSSLSGQELKQHMDRFYEELRGENYEVSYGNPAYCKTCFGEKAGKLLCYLYVRFRDGISYAYRGKLEVVLLRMELFLQVYGALSEDCEEDILREWKEIIYYDAYDYSDLETERYLEEMLNPDEDYYTEIVRKSDFSNTDYLYRYGENITENEIRMAKHLAAMEEEQLAEMAATYTEGFRKGFLQAGIDLSKKKSVNIRYPIGFEPMVRQALLQFEKMGLKPVIYIRTNQVSMGVETTPANRQYLYDHRYANSIYLNNAICKKRLKELQKGFKKREQLAKEYAGPACIEVFGQELFVPETKPESPCYTKEQEKLSVEYRRDRMLIQNEFIPRDDYSFTIIAYPVPEIGEKFEEIFDETVKVNTLDTKEYEKIQQALIDALDQGTSVRITGRGNNHTDITVKLHELRNRDKETNFENCLADVNIPLGEVFTSPVLTGTEGVLHVTEVYLEGLKYENLELRFKDGMIAGYSCDNYSSEQENQKYIKENILHNRETLPIGEFAIGTNTTAYVMGQKYQISAKLPILIAEKTGPHFAVGDTCYSMSEETPVKNPDGKEVIARDNECSILRKTDMAKAYFNCHTDITIPYSELGDIVVCVPDREDITLLHRGRFVLAGTEKLNEVLQEYESRINE